ncbi:MAG: hypothetical protein ACSLFK_04115 [Gemmatimonadaceae bacterium]
MGSSTFSALALLLVASVATAQDFPEQSQEVLTGPQRVEGKVVRPGPEDMIPVPGVWVTLHRVGTDASGPLDSARADARGRYSFGFERTGEEGAIYFVSATYSGIAYFTPPFHHSVTIGDEAEIAVFDTTSAPVPMSVRGHHVIVSAVNANATRSVTEVFEIANDSSVTRVVGAGQSGAVWSTALPAKASVFQVGHGDVPAGAIRFEAGHAHVLAPIAPGLKQISFSYSIPATAFPLRFPITRPTQVLEVLIEEEKGSVTGAMLKEVDPVSLEQRSFRRFLAADVPAGEVSLIDLPSAGVDRNSNRIFLVALTVVIAGAMAFVLARALRRR